MDIFTERMLHTAKPCPPKMRKPQLYGDTLQAVDSLLHGFYSLRSCSHCLLLA